MYGNTHAVAEAIGAGLGASLGVGGVVEVVSVHEGSPSVLAGADLLVVGGPTHAHGVSRAATRASAIEDAANPEKHLELDPDAEGDGLREWFDGLSELGVKAAAFDTRVDMAVAFTGRASKGIAKRLRRHGCQLVLDPESFLVTKETELEPHEVERATAWGVSLGAALTP
jgi:hypothetical protein